MAWSIHHVTNIITGFVVLYLYMNGTETQDVYPILIVFLSIVGSAELLRFNFEWFNQLYCYLLGPLMRPSEIKNRINGVVYYLLGKVFFLGSMRKHLTCPCP